MKPTEGMWNYNEEEAQIERLGKPLAVIYGAGGSYVPWEEAIANGYLMASAPNLRDELTNLSRAVRAYIEDPLLSYTTLEGPLARAERALATIFPPELTS